MSDISIINEMIRNERIRPGFTAIHLNSYLTNLPVENDNAELKGILRYFSSPEVYLSLYQKEEFVNGLSLEVKAEIFHDEEIRAGINYRESLFHNHDFFEMMYVYSGTCRNVIGHKEMRLEAGDLLLYNLQTVHKLILDDPEAVVFNILAGREVFSKSFLNLFSENNPVLQFYIHSLYDIPGDQYCAFHLSGNEALNPLHNMIAEFIQKDEMYEKVMYLDFQSLLVRLARIRLSTRSGLSVTYHEGLNINDVLMYIHDNYTDVTLQSIADHFSYTTRSMIRFLKKYTHKTFTEILRDFRLLSACNMLRYSNTSIDEIALQTGFSERSYFDRVFKQTFAVTPAEYRTSAGV